MIVDAKGREIEGNGADPSARQRAKVMQQNATIGEVNEIAHEHAKNAMAHLGNQIGPFVVKAIQDAIQGYHESLIERGIVPKEGPLGPPVDVASLVQRPIDTAPETIQ